jgi:predicted HAD superfamily Cof-like phosphohydrolase
VEDWQFPLLPEGSSPIAKKLMEKCFKDVLKFHKQFGCLIQTSPGFPDEKNIVLRKDLIKEELFELLRSIARKDVENTADAIADLIYVLIGTAIAFGIDLRPVWEEVQRANMDKYGGKKRCDGKQLKPNGWVPPDINKAVRFGKIQSLIDEIDDETN